jgi:hypothetical protein
MQSSPDLKEVPMNHQMFSKVSMIAMAAVIVSCLLMSGAPAPAQLQNSSNFSQGLERGCSNKTLSGDYGFIAQGILLGGFTAEFRSSGVAHFDGGGNLIWKEHTVINGSPVNKDWVVAKGTYTVNRNCTGSAAVVTPNSPDPLILTLVVVDHGDKVQTVLDSNAITTVFTKVNPDVEH